MLHETLHQLLNKPGILIALILWTIPWKGMALWRSARNKQRIWFIILLLVQTLAILDIIYIFGFQKKRR